MSNWQDVTFKIIKQTDKTIVNAVKKALENKKCNELHDLETKMNFNDLF